jgi:hypothetical protein
MPQVTRSNGRFSCFAIVALLAGCNGSGNVSGTTTAPGLIPEQPAVSPSLDKPGSGFLYFESFQSSGGSISVFAGSPLKLVRKITDGLSNNPEGMTFNSKRELYVATNSGVLIYPPDGDKPTRTLSKDVHDAIAVAVTSKNDAWVGAAFKHIAVFPNSEESGVKLLQNPALGFAIDSSDNVYAVDNPPLNTVHVYPDGATKSSRKITQGLDFPTGVLVDNAGSLYVTNTPSSACGSVTVYDTATEKLKYTITKGICEPSGMAVDSAGNLYVVSSGQGAHITEYAAGSDKVVETITKGMGSGGSLAIDPAGNLYVTNLVSSYEGRLLVYPHGQTSPSQTITGFGVPQGLKWLQ